MGAVRARCERLSMRLGMPYLLLLVALIVHALLFLVVLPTTHEDVVERGFIRLSYHDSGRALDGAIPYRDYLLEYPPGTLLFMIVPRMLASGFLTYRTLFFWENALLDAIVVVVLWITARYAGIPAWRALLLYTAAVVLLGPTIAYRLDLAPVALTAIAVLAWLRGRPTLAAVVLAAAVATKVYPALLLPPLLLDAWQQGGVRRARSALLAFAVTLMIWLSPVLVALRIAGLQPVLHAIRFQTNRHTQVESIWATPPLLAHLLTGFPLTVSGRARALVIMGPGDALGVLGTPAILIVALAVYWCWWRRRNYRDLHRVFVLGSTATLVLAAAMLNKVLSPQYLLWAMPSLALVPLAPAPRRHALALALFGAALPLTQWIYPGHYGELVRLLAPSSVVVLALRNLCLVVALIVLLSGLWDRRWGRAKR